MMSNYQALIKGLLFAGARLTNDPSWIKSTNTALVSNMILPHCKAKSGTIRFQASNRYAPRGMYI
jgi:hypothetical protein